MTTITVKQLHRPTREWERDEHIFAHATSGHLPTLIFDCFTVRNTFSNEPFFITTRVIPTEKAWLIPTLQKMSELPFHTDNWSTGAMRTEGVAIKQLLNALCQVLADEAPVPTIVPTWPGGVQAKWHRKGVDLEIFVNPGEPVGYYFNSNDTDQEGVASDDWAKLRGYAEAIV